MARWEEVRLGDLAVFRTGNSKLTKKSYTPSGQFVAFSGSGPDGRVDSPEVSGESVVVSAVGARCGGTWFATGEWTAIANTFWFRSKSDLVTTEYLYWATRGRDGWLKRGAAQPFIAQQDAMERRLFLPPMEHQALVCQLLRYFDDLIENSHRRIELLEETARLLYREWFVNFRYPGHEDVPLVDSTLGPIPEAWEVVALGDIADISKGLSYKGVHLSDAGKPMANLKCIAPGGGFRRDGVKGYDGPFKDRHAVLPGDIVVANTDLTQEGAIIGSAGQIPRASFETGGLLSHHLFRVRPKPRILREVLFESLLDRRFQNHAQAVASGTTVLGFRTDDAERYPVLLPSSDCQEDFASRSRPVRNLLTTLEQQALVLAEVRDLLLPRLVSGDLDISGLDLGLEAVG